MRRVAALAILAIVVAGCSMLPPFLRPAITRDEAIAIARRASEGNVHEGEPVLDARRLTYKEVGSELSPVVEGARPAPDDCVWFVNIGSEPAPMMAGGVFVTIDCDTGAVVHVTDWMS